ncbi:MAG: hypothetical protein QF662_09560, partial [Phycisphaerae bacterium]|nr:hypothetical protein [Phycisphaerae bacterium]
MKERLLFDRIGVHRYDMIVGMGLELPVDVLSNTADPEFPILNDASVSTEVALDLLPVGRFP